MGRPDVALYWLVPAASIGLLALALPVLVHLLSRQTRRHVLFPSLRFIHATRLAAVRRHALQDWPLLAVRLLILASAVAALAGPVFVSAARQAEWSTRVARAFVVVPGSTGVEQMLQEERQGSFASAVLTPDARVADGIRDAALWLAAQPPSAHDVVIVGDLREGAMAEADLAVVPAAAGIRFLVVPGAGADSRVDIPALGGPDRRLDGLPIAVQAAPEDQTLAHLALRAVLARGIALDRARARRVLILFDGAETGSLRVAQPPAVAWMREALERMPELSGGEAGGSLVVYAKQRAQGAGVPRLIDRVVRATFTEDLRNVEPRRVSAAAVASWSRPPSGTGAQVPGARGQVPGAGGQVPGARSQEPGSRSQVAGARYEGGEGHEGAGDDLNLSDEGDRRWLWGLALVLLGVEALMRRSGAARDEAGVEEEARVA